MISLLKSERFQEEHALYRSKIDKIADTELRKQAEVLLRNLINAVTRLDNQHQDMFSGNQLPTALGDARSGILTLRKKIDVMLKDWERSNPNA